MSEGVFAAPPPRDSNQRIFKVKWRVLTLIRRGGGANAPRKIYIVISTFYGLTQMKIIIGYIFAFYATKMGSKDSGETKVDLIGSRTRLRPSMDPTMALQYTKHGPLYIGYIFVYYATKMGSRDTGDIKVHPHWVWDPPWSFNGPCHGPPIHQTWPFTWILKLNN